MSFHNHISEEDYLKFNIYHSILSKRGKKTVMVYRLFLPVFVLIILLLMLVIKEDAGLLIVECIALIPISACWWIFAPKILRNSVKNSLTHSKKYGKLPYQADSEITISDGYLTEKNEQMMSRVPFDKNLRTCIHDGNIYIYTGSLQAVVIPCAQGDIDYRELLDLCKEYTTMEDRV